jgi:hypothetical protein
MKKILGILLAVCFLMSVTAAAVSADGNRGDKKIGDKNDKKIEKKVVGILKVVKTHNGVKKLELVKYTLKSHGHVIKVWFTKEWVVVKFNEHHNGPDH